MTFINLSNTVKRYFFLVVILSIGVFLFVLLTQNAEARYEYGKFSGTVAVYLFLTTLVPGIAKRLKFANKIKHLYLFLNLLRREIGILTFLFVWYHFFFLKGLESFETGQIYSPNALFEWFGLIAFQLLFLLFVTSNSFSVKQLGKWWKKLHYLTYIIIWFVMLHVASVEFSLAIIVFVFAVFEIYSLLYNYLFMRKDNYD